MSRNRTPALLVAVACVALTFVLALANVLAPWPTLHYFLAVLVLTAFTMDGDEPSPRVPVLLADGAHDTQIGWGPPTTAAPPAPSLPWGDMASSMCAEAGP